MILRHVSRAIFLLPFLGFFAIAPAGATGTVRIQQLDGTVRVYQNAVIRVKHNTIRVWTSDNKGTLVVDRAACSYVGEVQRCLPTTFSLVQNGQTKTIQLINGLVYFNLTGQAQALTGGSSGDLAAHYLMMQLHTMRGTSISVKGQIDEMKP